MPRGFQLGCMRIIAEISLFNHWYKIVNLKAIGPIRRAYRTTSLFVSYDFDGQSSCSIVSNVQSNYYPVPDACLLCKHLTDILLSISYVTHELFDEGRNCAQSTLWFQERKFASWVHIFLENLVTFIVLCRKLKEITNMHLKFIVLH